jgi:subtilisin-like proprotein convertase family protein
MHSKILVLALLAAASAFAPAQFTYSYAAVTSAAIPSSGTGGAPGGCGNSANTTLVTVNVPVSLTLTDVNVAVVLTHSYAHDLRITVTHGGTSVVLFNQFSGTQNKCFGNSPYTFDDQAATTIAASIDPNFACLIGGTYIPESPLSAFNGMGSAGPWTVEFCDLAGADTGVCYDVGITVTSGVFAGGYFQNFEPIPDGTAAGCGTAVTHVLNVPPSGPVAHVQLGFYLNHQRGSDLTINVAHGATSVTVCTADTPSSNLAAAGQYLFDDGAAQSWDQGLLLPAFSVPEGVYRPDSPLAAFESMDSGGLWFVTVCDAHAGVAGDLGAVMLGLEIAGFRFTLSQPAGSSSITLANSGGYAGDHYLNAFTLVPGSYPAGWLNGLDITMSELITQIGFGPPFFGVLDASGSATTTIPGPIPSGLALQYVSFELTPANVPLIGVPAQTYTTAP